MSNHRENGEKRLLGALLAITKNNQHLLVIKDESKPEMNGLIASSQQWYFDDARPALSLPGGGRGVAPTGNRQETLHQTISNETQEELHPLLQVPYARKRAGVRKQLYPFAQAQLKPGVSIQQFGATSLQVPYESFSRVDQRRIEEAVEKEHAFWLKIGSLFQLAGDTNVREFSYREFPLRPQLLAVALIHCLEETAGTASTTKHIIKANRRTIDFVQSESQRLGLPIRNGSFELDGTVSKSLSKSDKQFLLRPSQ